MIPLEVFIFVLLTTVLSTESNYVTDRLQEEITGEVITCQTWQGYSDESSLEEVRHRLSNLI